MFADVFSSILSNTSETLPISTTKNIACVGLSPDGNVAIVVDEGWTDENNFCSLCVSYMKDEILRVSQMVLHSWLA